MHTHAKLAAWMLTVFACAPSLEYPLPRAVGQTHNIDLPAATPSSTQSEPAQTLRGVEAIDPEVLAILYAGHRREIAEAKVVESRARDGDVRRLATTMVVEHTDALLQEERIAQSLDIESWDTQMSKRIARDATRKVEELETLYARELEKVYLEDTVSQHGFELALIEAKLLPYVQSSQLRAQIDEEAVMAKRHRQDARELQNRPRE